jgi:hypothetical protein
MIRSCLLSMAVGECTLMTVDGRVVCFLLLFCLFVCLFVCLFCKGV